MKFSEFYLCFTILVKFDIYFLGLPLEEVFGVKNITDNLLYLWPLKNLKESAILVKLFWYKVFVHWKLKILNFLMDFVLNLLQFLGLLVTATRGLASQVKEAEFELSVSHETTDNEPLQDKTPAYWTKFFAKLRYIGFHTWSKMLR